MNIDSIEKFLNDNLSEKRRKHIQGVADTAVRLAKIHGQDPEKARICALFHDMYKERNLDAMVVECGLPERYMGFPNLSHGKLAAYTMEHDYGIDDEDMLNAVSFHTTGRPEMSDLEKIIYLADGIEPARDYPEVDRLRALANCDLDAACCLSLRRSIEFVKAKGNPIDQDTIRAYEYYREKIKEKSMDSRTMALEAAKVLDDKLGTDVMAIDVAERSSFADYIVIASAGSERQAQSLAGFVDDRMAELGVQLRNSEGKNGTGWILMDYGDITVNLFTVDMRSKYNLENVWGDCDFLELDFE